MPCPLQNCKIGMYVLGRIVSLGVIRMNKPDIKNYFEKIYQIKVKNVNTRIQLGKVLSLQRTCQFW